MLCFVLFLLLLIVWRIVQVATFSPPSHHQFTAMTSHLLFALPPPLILSNLLYWKEHFVPLLLVHFPLCSVAWLDRGALWPSLRQFVWYCPPLPPSLSELNLNRYLLSPPTSPLLSKHWLRLSSYVLIVFDFHFHFFSSNLPPLRRPIGWSNRQWYGTAEKGAVVLLYSRALCRCFCLALVKMIFKLPLPSLLPLC